MLPLLMQLAIGAVCHAPQTLEVLYVVRPLFRPPYVPPTPDPQLLPLVPLCHCLQSPLLQQSKTNTAPAARGTWKWRTRGGLETY